MTNISNIKDNNAKYSLQKPPLLSNMLYIIGKIPIMSRFLSNKLDIFKVITLIIAKVLRF